MKPLAAALRTLCGWFGPRRRGRWFLPGLDENVEVLSDDYGVPHIFAHSSRDAFLVQGYLHARERAFQMDLQRRVGQGRLSELFGPVALPADRFLRKLGLWRHTMQLWSELETDTQSWLIRYAQGVNLGLRRLRPPECWLLGSKIEPWTGLHSLLWTQVMAFDMGSNWEVEWLRWQLLQKFGPEAAETFHIKHSRDFPSSSGPAMGAALDSLWSEYRSARSALDQWISWGGGSNAWAVSPGRSQSGLAMLASDPHVLAKVPSTWFEVHLECPEFNLYGASLPGMPGVVIGHNDHLAWGITNSYVDTQDLVLERVEGDRVLRPEGWLPLRRRDEKILVKGRGVEIETVWETEEGPVLFMERPGATSAAAPPGTEQGGVPGGAAPPPGTAVSLRWSGWTPGDRTVRAWRQLLSCREVKAAQQVLHGWSNPCLNFVLADSQGNIGYQLAGRVPRRQDSYGILPQPGWEEAGRWCGWVDPELLPSSYNPECGYVVSANHAPQPLDREPFLGVDFCDGYRAQRIAQRLEAVEKLSLDDFAAIQVDTVSLAARRFLQLLARDQGGAAWRRPDLLDELLAWDGDMAATSRPAAVYQVFLWQTTRHAYEGLLSSELFLTWCGAPVSTLAVLGGQTGRYISFLLDAWTTQAPPSGGSWGELLERAWNASLEELETRLGANIRGWRWGRLHRFQPEHALGRIPILGELFNAPAVELGGDVTTVLQSAMLAQQPYAARGWVPSYRLVVEPGDPESSRSVLPTGQAGWVGDPMQFNQLRLWSEARLHPSLKSRQQLELSRPERLVLLA